MIQPLDGPSAQTSTSVTSGAVVEVKAGGTPLDDRKVVTIQPLDGRIRLYFGDGSGAPTVGTVSSDGALIFKRAMITLEASTMQDLWIVAESSTTDVVIIERA